MKASQNHNSAKTKHEAVSRTQKSNGKKLFELTFSQRLRSKNRSCAVKFTVKFHRRSIFWSRKQLANQNLDRHSAG